MPHVTARDLCIATAALALGWWAHSRPVRAAEDAPANLGFQFNNVGPQSSLMLYDSAAHTLTVYNNATVGNSHVSCSYQYRISHPGAPLERSNCQPGSLLP